MKYFIDTEFIERWKKPIKWLPTFGNFNKPYHSIQLISIGMVAEDGREYYAISNEFNPNDANDWVKENVLSKLPERHFNGSNAQEAKLWKSNKQIAEEIFDFINPHHKLGFEWKDYSKNPTVKLSVDHDITFKYSDFENSGQDIGYAQPDFYAYYADYDWVLFCSLFGAMIDLPKGFPMYCIDIKQTLDEMQMKQADKYPNQARLEAWLAYVKNHLNYPKQQNEHNALDDARWNKKLYEFLQSI